MKALSQHFYFSILFSISDSSDASDTLFVCDTAHDAIRAVDTASGFVYTLTSYKQAYTPVAFPFQVWTTVSFLKFCEF